MNCSRILSQWRNRLAVRNRCSVRPLPNIRTYCATWNWLKTSPVESCTKTPRLSTLTLRKNCTGEFDFLVSDIVLTNNYCLCRDVCLLEQELQQKEMCDEKLRHDLQVEKEKAGIALESQDICEVCDFLFSLLKGRESIKELAQRSLMSLKH